MDLFFVSVDVWFFKFIYVVGYGIDLYVCMVFLIWNVRFLCGMLMWFDLVGERYVKVGVNFLLNYIMLFLC